MQEAIDKSLIVENEYVNLLCNDTYIIERVIFHNERFNLYTIFYSKTQDREVRQEIFMSNPYIANYLYDIGGGYLVWNQRWKMSELTNLYSRTSRKIIAKRIAKREEEILQENSTKKGENEMKYLVYAIAFLIVMFFVTTFESFRCMFGC